MSDIEETREQNTMKAVEQIEEQQTVSDDPMAGLLSDVTINEVLFASWVAAAGLYGHINGRYYEVMQSTETTVEFTFMAFGLALGVAFSATVVHMQRHGENE